MPRFSLIVATFGRTHELSTLLESLARQQLRDFELVIVDQNPDDRVTGILEEWKSGRSQTADDRCNPISPKHLRCSSGASKARNMGLLQCSGEIIAFPDDDCWYHPDTLKRVDEWFRTHTEYGILSIGCRNEEGRVSSNRWWQSHCDLAWINIFRTSGTCCFFVRRPDITVPLTFDESLGPGAGTIFGCGEDTDFLLSLMEHGIHGRFDSSFCVGHPCRDGFVDVRRASAYGAGFGRVLRKHRNPWLFVGLAAFDFARAAIRILSGDRDRASRMWAHGRGMIRAYFSSVNHAKMITEP